MKIWKKVTALVLSLAMTLSASATVLAQAPSIKEGHVTTTASVTNDGIYINGKYYTKTGVPAMIGAMLIMNGTWKGPGVKNIEEFDPDPFMDALNKWGLPWKESFDPELVD